jgi:site-specific recombinase XerD
MQGLSWSKIPLFPEQAQHAGKSSKEPAIHSLRHTFAVNRINNRVDEGIPLNAMLSHLVRYLGHSEMEGTLFCCHQVIE